MDRVDADLADRHTDLVFSAELAGMGGIETLRDRPASTVAQRVPPEGRHRAAKDELGPGAGERRGAEIALETEVQAAEEAAATGRVIEL